MKTNHVIACNGRVFFLFWLALAAAAASLRAQTTTGSIRGYVRAPGDAPVSAAIVAARNVDMNVERGTTTNDAGFYNLAGLRPGQYELSVRRIGFAPRTRTVQLLIGQTLDINFQIADTAITLAAVEVVASPETETQTSEVATNVTQQQINNLPTPGRNFLDLAALAPGVRVDPDRVEGTGKKFAAGAQSAENINVFVDGASYKNDIVLGGVAGQDASRGNPFPRNAVQEFRITTSNFKAEYQKASSAIISAVTKSGTNVWIGSAFVQFQNKDFVALDTFARARRATTPNFEKPEYERYLAGLSLGGPIVRDKMFFFGSYEGNFQDREGVTRFFNIATAPAPVRALEGEVHTSPFRQHSFFGKLTYNRSERQLLEFSGDWRHETDTRGFGNLFACPCQSFSNAENAKNDVATARLKHSYFGSMGINEAMLGYQWYNFNPTAIDFTTPSQEFEGHGRIGGREASQDLSQRRITLRDDFTFSPRQMSGTHVAKVGASVDFAHYDMTKLLKDNPVFFFRSAENFARPYRAEIGFGDPSVTADNTQFGIYAQDDWSPTPRLTLNLGLRWDYESGMYNLDYVSPQAVRDSVSAFRSQLFVDVDPNRYFTDGDDREAFYGAIQPRVGLSYALDQNGRTTLFGSWGIFYDRLNFNATLDETYLRQHPIYSLRFGNTASGDTLAWDPSLFSREGLRNVIENGVPQPTEVFLISNDLKPPHSNQWSVGGRHDFGSWNAALTYTQTRSYNGFSYEWANLSFRPGTRDCCDFRNVPAYRNVLVGRNDIHTWYDALFVQVDRPYRPSTRRWGWGAGLAWTIAKAEAEGGDLFTFPQVRLNPRHPISDDERHRVVANWLTDIPYAWGIQFSGLITLGSGRPFNKNTGTPAGTVGELGAARPEKFNFIFSDAFAYRSVDLRLRKDFPNIGGSRFGVTADVFNVFNWDNFGCFDEFAGSVGTTGTFTPNANFGRPNCVIADARRLQIGLSYDLLPGVIGSGGR